MNGQKLLLIIKSLKIPGRFYPRKKGKKQINKDSVLLKNNNDSNLDTNTHTHKKRAQERPGAVATAQRQYRWRYLGKTAWET